MGMNLVPMRKTLFLWILAILIPFAGREALAQGEGTLELSEFMAANAATLADEDGEYPDWIEVRNTGSTGLNLEGWSLTDDPALPAKWQFPSTNLATGAYLVVFASGKDRKVPGRPLHASFSLGAGGEYLALANPEQEIVTEYAPEYPEQKNGVSYGLRLGRQYFFDKPTPGSANTGGFNEFVADTKFSHGRGFYTAPFDLTISTATAGATIRYTTNGTLPALTNGLTYLGPIRIPGTTVVRAAAFKTGEQPSNADTQTYLFLEDVIRQSPTGQPAPGWPSSWGQNVRDYGMDPDVVNNPKYASNIVEDLKSIPSFSIVMDLNDLFSSSRGIYANPSWQGRTAERKCSVELVHPDGKDGFQIDCGIRIRGGFSRSTDNPKHAFRFLFREEYGDSKLRYPLLSQGGAEEFDGIDLRTFQNYSWSFQGDSQGIFVRDQFSRDAQLAMGHDAERGDYYHLYINGQYWGLYNTCERPEASYGETYFGGRKEDYDVVKVEAGPYTVVATDGNLQAWTRLYNACKGDLSSDAAYEKLLGNNPDGTPNPSYERLIEPDNLIDYMLVIIYGGNLDAPISNFLQNTRPNNWYGVRNRTGRDGFRFFAHDAEHTLLNVNENRVGPFTAGDTSVTYSSPQWVWQKLWANAEFKLRVADRIQRHFFNGGVLTPQTARELFLKRKDEIDRAVVAESARWGDAKRTTPLTRDNWLSSINTVLNNYLPQRTDRVLSQLRTRGLYPNVAAPSFSQHGGAVAPGVQVTVQVPAGQGYYTVDGSDPRLRGGAISPAARTPGQPITIQESFVLKARALNAGTWSALVEANFTVIQNYTNLLVTEVMYHPQEDEEGEDNGYEFVELKNVNPFEIDLSGVRFSEGIRFTFPLGTRLGPGHFVVLARNAALFAQRYPQVRLDGVYEGSLANAGERLTLEHAVGTPLFSMAYGDAIPWPEAADGLGFSLVPVTPNRFTDPNAATEWRASSQIGGSPGRDDPAPNVTPVVINEILTHTDLPQVDAVELHNPTSVAADISHWYLTDDAAEPMKYRFPAGTVILPGGFHVVSELEFNSPPGAPGTFRFSSLGDEVYLYSADAAGRLTGYSDGVVLGAAPNGITFGRYTNSVGEVDFPLQLTRSLGQANSGPRLGPVVLNEIAFQPPAGEVEFLELKNVGNEPVPLYDPAHPTNTWRVAGIGFEFPPGAILPPNGLAVVSASDPTWYRTRYGIPASVLVFGPMPGVLQDGGELIEIQRPDAPNLVTNGVGVVSVEVPYLTVDAVRYNDKAPWPTNAAGYGASLERLHPVRYANDPASWRGSPGVPSPGLENDGNRPPTADAGSDLDFVAESFPASASLAGTAGDDGLPAGAGLRVTWEQLSGPGKVVFTSPHALTTQALFSGTGDYILRLRVSDGDLERTDELSARITRPGTQQTLVSAGAEWRYLDDGSDQGTAWRAPAFSDTAWRTGRARLGYGGDGEVTTIRSGPAGGRYITSYFRRRFNVTSPGAVTGLLLKVIRDDGVVVYLNGEEVLRNNMPENTITSSTRASATVGGTDETTFIEGLVDPSLLRAGENVIAAEVHQVNATSSDLGFELQLEATVLPSDRPPTVAAGSDFSGEVNTPLLLNGSFGDDALPNPPGVVTVAWSKVSGSGDVVFEDASRWVTTATFEAPGTYVLRLTATDSATSVSDEVTVAIDGGTVPPVVQAFHFGTDPAVTWRLTFSGTAGSYSVFQTEELGSEVWSVVATATIAAGQSTATAAIPYDPAVPIRFYRVERNP